MSRDVFEPRWAVMSTFRFWEGPQGCPQLDLGVREVFLRAKNKSGQDSPRAGTTRAKARRCQMPWGIKRTSSDLLFLGQRV